MESALAVAPASLPDFAQIDGIADKAKADKKNTDDDKIRMAVAKAKGVWTDFQLPFEK